MLSKSTTYLHGSSTVSPWVVSIQAQIHTLHSASGRHVMGFSQANSEVMALSVVNFIAYTSCNSVTYPTSVHKHFVMVEYLHRVYLHNAATVSYSFHMLKYFKQQIFNIHNNKP